MNSNWMNWALALVSVPSLIAVAQVPQRELPLKEQRSTVTVPFFAVDGHGNPIGAIGQIDVSVLDNKIPPKSVVSTQSARELPLRLGVLIDTSNSERRNDLYQPGVQATLGLLSQVMGAPGDRAFLVNVATTPNGTGLMDREEILRLKFDLTPGGATALFDAINFACKERLQADPQPARRVLVILSDGGDNQSHVSQNEAIAAAQKAGTVIFAVSTSENPNGNLDSGRLEQFADKTGGHAFLHLSRKDLPKVFSSIREQIENMYAVTFVPADFGKPGQYHPIELKMTSDKKVKLRAPKGYYATAGVQ
jgi:Ca-activated chloride channel homolog